MARRRHKKHRTHRRRRQTARQRAASLRNLKKARRARRRRGGKRKKSHGRKRRSRRSRKSRRRASRSRRRGGHRLGLMQRLIKRGYSPERAYKIAERANRMRTSAAMRKHASSQTLANAFAGFGFGAKAHKMAHS